ncbi:MAG: Biotin/lipoate A/B protein ligase [Candelina mexicana]|nr:MAG: Biotin/lipoate A/B protein ligase [Candelina mexicana]
MFLLRDHRQFLTLHRIRSVWRTACGFKSLGRPFYSSIAPTRFTDAVTNSAVTRQIYISRSTNPYLNLSIEHFLLQRTPPDSTILFLYTNKPCVVIGRNQNPWVEVNLQLLNAAESPWSHETESPDIGDVLLVRRRSGGGTVFHDEGNVNYSVICPPNEFSRDKHAEMVVRALHGLGIARARVNNRHDIVLDQGSPLGGHDRTKAHMAGYPTGGVDGSKPLKISGSAYKLTRLRALHHGTCLLSSPNLNIIPHYLHSPAKPFIKARGVDSVSSPVGNVGVANVDFERSVVEQFAIMHGLKNGLHAAAMQSPVFEIEAGWVAGVVDDAQAGIPEIGKGLSELRSSDWKYTQTPQFTFSSHPVEEDQRIKPNLPTEVPASTRVILKARSANITESQISLSADATLAEKEAASIAQILSHRKLHEIRNWNEIFQQSKLLGGARGVSALANWLNTLLRKAS